jgi:hypothetical protein
MKTTARRRVLVLCVGLALCLQGILSEEARLLAASADQAGTTKGLGVHAGDDDSIPAGSWRAAQSKEKSTGPNKESPTTSAAKRSRAEEKGSLETDKVWRSDDINVLGVGIGVGDVAGNGQNHFVIISPDTVYLYRISGGKMEQVSQYSAGSLELKSVDVAKIRKQGPARIYVTAQNRGTVASFVLEYRGGKLEPVIQDVRYFLRVIEYPTQGPILLGQQKGLNRMYEGPVFRVNDKGNELEEGERFGIPLKIPVFGFAIGDLEGKRSPLIVAYDKEEHLRIYTPLGKRLFLSKDYFSGSDIILRWSGPENRRDTDKTFGEIEKPFFRPRIMCVAVNPASAQEILTITHSSKTARVLSRTKMLEDGRISALIWNGDATEEKWRTPPIQGMVTDFAVDFVPGLSGRRLIVLERKKTDWLSFLRSASQVKAYDLESLASQGMGGER